MNFLNIVQISDTDIQGRRFNGHDLQIALNSIGHQAYHFVVNKDGNETTTIPLISGRGLFSRSLLIEFEQRLSMNGLAFIAGDIIKDRPEFQTADVVHYHLIHNYMLSLLDFPDLVMSKPSVWTIHDPWAFTGHCIHPMECFGWKTGCSPCPRIHDYFPMKYDKARQMWNIKKMVYKKMDIDIVVASHFMKELVNNSPLTAHFENVHIIPFGIKTKNFYKARKRDSRIFWRIPENNFVIAFRSEQSEFKGVKYILEMLQKLNPSRPVTLLSIGYEPLPLNVKTRYHTIELGWQNNPNIIYNFYAACDIFLMPSIAESFGLMAVEAMASARAVIVFEGTALPSVTFAPECGIAIPNKDSDALKETIERLMQNQNECDRRGEKGREIAEKYYRFEDYISRHITLYEDIVSRKKYGN